MRADLSARQKRKPMKTALPLLAILAHLATPLLFGASEEPPVSERVAGRDFPSVFQAWNPATTPNGESRFEMEARHDLVFHAADFFGLRWDAESQGLATSFAPDSLKAGRNHRQTLLASNPKMVLLCEIRYRDAHRSFLPTTSEWWARDEDGKPIVGWEEGGYLMLDLASEDYQNHVARRAKAAVDSGVFDGVFLDWWEDDDERVSLAKKVRAAIGEDALILVNANDRKSPRSAEFVNGHFMECYRSKEPGDWKKIEESLVWAEANLRKPRINCLETWYAKSRRDLPLMRATTALALTRSDGYVLFADPNPLPTPDHLHDWYPFWDAQLGKPLAAGKKRTDGSNLRRFENGTVVYNPPGKPVTVTFAQPHRRQSDGRVAKSHTIAALDGEIFLRVEDPTQ